MGEKVIDITDSTSENSKFEILNSKFESGWYKIVATSKDKYGEDIGNTVRSLGVFDNESQSQHP